MENAASEGVTLVQFFGAAGVAAVVAGIFGLLTLLINRYWAKKDEKNGKLKEIQDSIQKMDSQLAAHIEADDERYAIQCRARILRFADELINEPNHLHTKGQFDQTLNDITDYDLYCSSHPKFKNELTLRSTEIIRSIYDECAREHKFL